MSLDVPLSNLDFAKRGSSLALLPTKNYQGAINLSFGLLTWSLDIYIYFFFSVQKLSDLFVHFATFLAISRMHETISRDYGEQLDSVMSPRWCKVFVMLFLRSVSSV